ncbi:uncharacterized protein LOC117181948 [Belonocnema kinseyi]|uniref:uncharacterized protein LOC117181948 n=1 Tax=Belonocnema kinseyi TaxID=2817044 RepID=UPI00143D6BC9|nr:uncharacterized protein LOC117181948 [Belonocnema kinseyi]
MKKIPFSSFLILFGCFLPEIVSSFEEINESSVPHNRQKRMNTAPPVLGPSHPWAPEIPGFPQSLYDFNFDLPDLVHITRHGQMLGIGIAVHPFLVVARASFFEHMNDNNIAEFVVRSQGIHDGFTVEHNIRFADVNEICDTTLIEVREPILLERPERESFYLEQTGLTMRGIYWAEHEATKIRQRRIGHYSRHPDPLQPNAFQREHMIRRYRPRRRLDSP